MPFYRSLYAGSHHQGSGLGLAIAKGFVNAGGGEISVESLPGQGTSFIVDLPADTAAPDLEVAEHAPEAQSTQAPAVRVGEWVSGPQ